MRVLIAEDEIVPRMILEATLEGFGHECIVAEDGLRAWEIYAAEPRVDVVISDWIMPGMDGLELCRKVRSEGKDDGYTYFIFLTALDDKGHLLSGMQEGADDYLHKPLDPDELQVRMIAASRVTSLHRQLADQKAELFEQSRKDPLTGLGNRLSLHEDVEVLRGWTGRYGHGYCALLCDVDSFKPYNDHYGHLAGDEVLRRVAKALVDHSRAGDKVYRYGGEEFLIIIPEQSLASATVAADRVRAAVEGLSIPHEARESLGVVTISVGVAALSPSTGEGASALLARADEALYRAKEAGRNRVVVHQTAGEEPG